MPSDATSVSGWLSRHLRRKLVDHFVRANAGQSPGHHSPEALGALAGTSLASAQLVQLTRCIQWIPRVWTHLNSLMQSDNSNELFPAAQFLQCPVTGSDAVRVWLAHLYNYSLLPFLSQSLKPHDLQTVPCIPQKVTEHPASVVQKVYLRRANTWTTQRHSCEQRAFGAAKSEKCSVKRSIRSHLPTSRAPCEALPS